MTQSKEVKSHVLEFEGIELGRFRSLREKVYSEKLLKEAITLFGGNPDVILHIHWTVKNNRYVFELIVNCGQEFFEAAQEGNAEKLQELLNRGMPVNLVEPTTGATALHFAAAHGARAALRVLLSTEECDFLARDKKERLSSAIAEIHGQDPAMARLLRYKEFKTAQEKGVTLKRRKPLSKARSVA